MPFWSKPLLSLFRRNFSPLPGKLELQFSSLLRRNFSLTSRSLISLQLLSLPSITIFSSPLPDCQFISTVSAIFNQAQDSVLSPTETLIEKSLCYLCLCPLTAELLPWLSLFLKYQIRNVTALALSYFVILSPAAPTASNSLNK